MIRSGARPEILPPRLHGIMNDSENSITVQQLRQWFDDGTPCALLDVREPWELEICRFPDARAIPLSSLPARVGELGTTVPLVVICHHGIRSLHAVAWLQANGIAGATNLSGGIDAWAREIDPSMGVY